MAFRTFIAMVHKERNVYVADCPEVGTVSQRYSIEEAITNLKEATELYLEDFPLPNSGQPVITTFEVTYSNPTGTSSSC